MLIFDGGLFPTVYFQCIFEFGLIGIPITNAAKDRGWETIFSFSHGFSVYCTIVIFALSIIQFFINFD